MTDHHFSYPVVVPLQGATISGHATIQPPSPVLLRPVQAPVRAISGPAPKPASLAA